MRYSSLFEGIIIIIIIIIIIRFFNYDGLNT